MSSTPPTSLSDTDLAFMRRALQLATHSVGVSDPNPRVGCVIVGQDGNVIAEGFTQPAGHAHAEAAALGHATALGRSVAGATAYVTLEPCAHQGRTPPCANALIAAGIRRAVVAIVDPNPLVAGVGIRRMQSAGIDVAVGLLAEDARELNIGFFSRMVRNTPWVRLKTAASLDGRTALTNGASQWITGQDARSDGHAWRKRAGAVVTGVGTVVDDDPRLDVRLVPTQRQPLRVVIDSRLQSPIGARIFDLPGRTLVYAAADDVARRDALTQRGVEVVIMPNESGKVDLRAAMADLAVRGVNEVHLEAGSKLSGSMVRENLVDEYLIYLAPKLLGAGRDMADFGPLEALADGVDLRFESVTTIGNDIRVIARPLGRSAF